MALFLNACKIPPKGVYKVLEVDSSISEKRISISELVINYKSYHGRYIETTGKFYYAFEEFAIYTNKNLFSNEARGFWLDLNPDLNINDTSFEKMDGKLIRVRGVIDTTRKGHLNSYLATISNIYYWEEE